MSFCHLVHKCQFANVSVSQFSDFIKTQDQSCGCGGLDKVRTFQDWNFVNSISTVLAKDQISFCHEVIARQSDSSLTLIVNRLTTSDSQSLVLFWNLWFSQIQGQYFRLIKAKSQSGLYLINCPQRGRSDTVYVNTYLIKQVLQRFLISKSSCTQEYTNVFMKYICTLGRKTVCSFTAEPLVCVCIQNALRKKNWQLLAKCDF